MNTLQFGVVIVIFMEHVFKHLAIFMLMKTHVNFTLGFAL